MTVEYNARNFRGKAASTDIVEAAALVCLEFINRIVRPKSGGVDTGGVGPAASGP